MFEIVLENQWQILRTLSALCLKLGEDYEVMPLAQRIAATERELIAIREDREQATDRTLRARQDAWAAAAAAAVRGAAIRGSDL
jgi:hypothetical protein